jgi:hypothetical protein
LILNELTQGNIYFMERKRSQFKFHCDRIAAAGELLVVVKSTQNFMLTVEEGQAAVN